jgi:hypothetical protein
MISEKSIIPGKRVVDGGEGGCKAQQKRSEHGHTCPTKLNQPVIQDRKAACCLGASVAAQKYGPPLVGMAETISAMESPTKKVMKATGRFPRQVERLVSSVQSFSKRRYDTEPHTDEPSAGHNGGSSGVQTIASSGQPAGNSLRNEDTAKGQTTDLKRVVMPVMTLYLGVNTDSPANDGPRRDRNGGLYRTIMEKETPKLWISDQSRRSSCLYPSWARRLSSWMSTASDSRLAAIWRRRESLSGIGTTERSGYS